MNEDKLHAAREYATSLKYIPMPSVDMYDNPHILYAVLEIDGHQYESGEWHYKPFDHPKLARLEREQLIAWQTGAFYNPVDMALIRQKREKWERKDNAI